MSSPERETISQALVLGASDDQRRQLSECLPDWRLTNVDSDAGHVLSDAMHGTDLAILYAGETEKETAQSFERVREALGDARPPVLLVINQYQMTFWYCLQGMGCEGFTIEPLDRDWLHKNIRDLPQSASRSH